MPGRSSIWQCSFQSLFAAVREVVAYVKERVEIDTVCMYTGALLDVESPRRCSRII